MGVAQRVDVRVKVPFAARVRSRVALIHRRLVIWATIALLATSVISRIRDRFVNFDPSENEDFVVFDVPAVDVPEPIECCLRGYSVRRKPIASVVTVGHLLCSVGHHDGGGRECSGLDLHGARVLLIRGDRGCVGALVERRQCACRCCCWPFDVVE